MTCPVSRPSTSASWPVTVGRRRAGVGADGADRAEAHAQVADARRVALEDVERASSVPLPKTSPFIGGERSASPGTRTWYVARDGLKMPRYDWIVAASVPGRAADDPDLVDDHVRPAQQAADAERADREHDDQRRHRDPRPLAPVEAPQDEVVHRPDEEDVAEQQDDQAADRRQREARQVHHRRHDLGVVGERGLVADARPAAAAATAACPRSRRRRSSEVVGSNPSSVTEPLPTLRSAGDHAVARGGQRCGPAAGIARVRGQGARPCRARRRGSGAGRLGSTSRTPSGR